MINKEAIEGLEPKRFWHHLAEIAEIPRGSGNEAGVREYVIGVAKKHGLTSKTDKAGNLVVVQPATKGLSHLPSVALQGHLDMVCEKNKEVVHDFLKDPIQFVRDGNIMRASGTTAGFDNGVDIATACMLMEDEYPHGPLEYLFTIEEEIGLIGANRLEPGFITSKILINLDMEGEGQLYIGCAGGKQTKGTIPIATEEVSAGSVKCILKVSGLKGGHSGLNIHEKHANAITVLVGGLLILGACTGAKIAYINGGDKHNAIPKESY
jgi:dipeptidase D